MCWIKFKERKPKEGNSLITRSPGWNKIGDCFEDWRKWKKEILTYNPPLSHWWDGEFDFSLAVKEWVEHPNLEDRLQDL